MRIVMVAFVLVASAAVWLVCNPPVKPTDPVRNAGIDSQRSLNFLNSLNDSIVAGRQYSCTIYINEPRYVDSVCVTISQGKSDSILWRATIAEDDSIVSFSLLILKPAVYELKVLLVRFGGSRDSMVRTITVMGSADPYSIAGIDRQITLRNLMALRDSIRNDKVYPCTLAVVLPEYLDSCRIKVDGTLILAMPAILNPLIVFPLQLSTAGQHTITMIVYRKNLTVDSLSRSITVFEPMLPRITTIRPVEGAFRYGESFACTVSVSLPTQADSFYARVVYGSNDTLIQRGKIEGKSKVVFDVPVRVVGGFELRVKIKRVEGTWDSAATSYTGLSVGTPTITPDSTLYHVILRDSIHLWFTVSDPDSNLWRCSSWIDLPNPLPVRTFYPPKSSTVRYSRTFYAESIGDGRVIVFAQATDFSNQMSVVAACTVIVVDTIPPTIALLPPFNQASNPVSALPITLRVLVTDDSPIDSVLFNTTPMAISGDTATIVISMLPTGVSSDTISAWDRGGEKAMTIVTFNYSGPIKYPPQIKSMNRTIKEGAKIDTIWLDTCVTLTLPPSEVPDQAAYKKDSIFWKVSGESGLFKIFFDSLRHRVFIMPPDTQLRTAQVVSEALRFRVVDSRGEADEKIGVMVMIGVNSVPVVTIRDQTVCGNSTFDTLLLDTCYKDAEDPPGSGVEWSFTNGKVLKVEQIKSCTSCPPGGGPCIPICFNTRKIVVIPDPAKINPDSAAKWRGSDTLSFQVKDLDGAWSALKKVVFTRQSICYIIPPLQFPKIRADVAVLQTEE